MSKQLTRDLWTKLLPRLKYVLTDCDGVLWHGPVTVPGAPQALDRLRKHGLKIGFVTNNSSRSTVEIVEKCRQQNIEAYTNEVFCVNRNAAKYLKAKGVSGKLYVIGTDSLKSELEAEGFTCIGLGPDPTDGRPQSFLRMQFEKDIQAVIVGIDHHFNMAKVCKAATYLQNPRCHFVATDTDKVTPNSLKSGVILPSTASLVAAVEVPSGRKAIDMGKPSHIMADMIRQQYPDMANDNTLFIGDYIETDIEFGRRQGFHTLLVETGIHRRSDITQRNAPSFYTQSIADIIDFMP